MLPLNHLKLIFLDFDGVVKDSVEVKTQAYVQLFQPFGSLVTERVRDHHETHGGMSRFDKLPLYLQWAGEGSNQLKVNEFCDQFSRLVLQKVIDAPWVPGAEAFLRTNPHKQTFILVSATPQDELEQILDALDLTTCFAEVFGAPVCKQDAISMMLVARKLNPRNCIMIGDARADMEAATANKVSFLLRRHESNASVFSDYKGLSIMDFNAL